MKVKMTLSTVQQHLLSYFNLTSVSSLKSSLEIFEEIINQENADQPISSVQLSQEVLEINKTIQKYDLEIVETIDEISGEKLFVLVNIADNIITQKSKFYDENTSQLFSKIVKGCVLCDEGNISEMYCLNLSSEIKMTKSAVQTALEKLVADKWLVSLNNRISLGMRSIVELQQSIQQHYPDNVKNCHFCKLIVIQGYICSSCKTKCHIACLKKYLEKMQGSKCICPICKEYWNDVRIYINVEDSNEEEKDLTSSTSPPRKRTRKSCIAD